MTKTHIISAEDVSVFEKSVNSFIADKNVIDIKYQSLLITKQYDRSGIHMKCSVIDRALIIYEEDDK